MKILLISVVFWAQFLHGLTDLAHLNVIFRHGARTPLQKTYPNDPYVDFNYPPYGRGQLTQDGKEDGYNLGTQLRNRYGSFLSFSYNRSEFSFYADGSTRVQETGLSTMASLWPPKEDDLIEPTLRWQPVPYQFYEYYPNNDDYFELANEPEYRSTRLAMYESNITTIMENSGITNMLDIMDVWSTVSSQVSMDMDIPDWLTMVYPEPLTSINYNIFAAAAWGKDLRANMACRVIRSWLSDIKSFIQESEGPKSKFFAAHDSNIVVMLECLNLRQSESPSFATNLALELHLVNESYSVRVVYQQKLQEQPKPLIMEGCTEFCPYENFLELFNDYSG